MRNYFIFCALGAILKTERRKTEMNLSSALLHAASDEHTGRGSAEFLEEVLWHGLLDTLKIIPFLLLTYILMELIEHKASDKARAFMEHAGVLGPLAGGVLGAVPQCGFSAAASNFYTGRVITLGTLIAVFLSTSDEMLPILISGKVSPLGILAILGYKALVGIAVGFIIDIIIKLTRKRDTHLHIGEMCEEGACHCENGIFRSALHHTLTVGGFILLITVGINALVFFVGSENIAAILYDKPVISHLIASAIGLIPNCAVSVALTDFCLEGFITAGTMLSGLFSGAGVGLLILFRVNSKHLKENLTVMGVLILAGAVFGLIGDLIGIGALI